jgi:hypothetical protein
MEAHWKQIWPDLQWDLLNASQAQLDLSVCEGFLIHSRAEDYTPMSAPDFTLISYMLGHVHARELLEKALEYTPGPVIVLDVFDSTAEFNSTFEYNAPTSGMMRDVGFHEVKTGPWIVNPYITDVVADHLVRQSTPQLWISE